MAPVPTGILCSIPVLVLKSNIAPPPARRYQRQILSALDTDIHSDLLHSTTGGMNPELKMPVHGGIYLARVCMFRAVCSAARVERCDGPAPMHDNRTMHAVTHVVVRVQMTHGTGLRQCLHHAAAAV